MPSYRPFMNARSALCRLYVAGVHLLLLAALATSDFLPMVAEKLGFRNAADYRNRSYYSRTLECQSRADANAPDGAVAFIGDSTIQGLCVAAIADGAVNYGIAGDTTRGVLSRLSAYPSLARARAIVVAAGVNDLGGLPDWKIVRNWTAIADGLPAHVPTFFVAILPIDESRQPRWAGRNRGLIRSLNEQLGAQLERRKNRYFIDPSARFRDATGNLSPALHVGDGLHLNAAGNAILIDVLGAALETAGCARPGR